MQELWGGTEILQLCLAPGDAQSKESHYNLGLNPRSTSY